MTPAEQTLFDIMLLEGVNEESIEAARRNVLRERMPPEFESTLRSLCERYDQACCAMIDYEKKHPLGHELRHEFCNELRKARSK